ncbi:TetR/AcrR family transcriptional regulator [Dactylosporangium matsuzakiense]|uniref:TetR family transcriptional regulator n=1 Tax=Dactylosporangium matsuzakiense TaxID=53360 RepID=A0A9W6NSG3_9ACTN|nr:TetR/AcrR family transcriptional regulator [Dactylosporangium matsuzakiense]GLL07453.1 TetR family transcriptional regulator [Dactylosporangium matsuzakiense]
MLDAETIMLATEDVLRRHGPAKATVVDVARSLGVSHAAVYRHFPSKAALREAVTRRWLHRAYDDLAAIAADTATGPAERLRAWVFALFRAKRDAAARDPEIFATYRVLAAEHSVVAGEHVEALLGQLETIVGSAATARAVFTATAAFHHPAHAQEWSQADRETVLADLCALLVEGLPAR